LGYGVRLLVTRPEADGERTAALLRARGHDVVLAPLLRIEQLDFELPENTCSAVVMTSVNAARAVVRHPRRDTITALEAFTVGRHTAEAARAAGFRTVHSADGDKDDLADLLRACLGENSAPLLYLAGQDRAGDLAVGGMPIATVVAYRAVMAERFAPAVAGLSRLRRARAHARARAGAGAFLSLAASRAAAFRRRRGRDPHRAEAGRGGHDRACWAGMIVLADALAAYSVCSLSPEGRGLG
jgi:uroporphyrinogen-III synthase